MEGRTTISTPSGWTLVWGELIVAGVVVQIILSTHRLLTPVDVGGTLFGGAMDAVGHAALWMLAMAGAILTALLRLPGFRLAWIAAGGAPILSGALALWSYPDDASGNLIFSPQRSEIVAMMALGGAMLIIGLILRRYVSLSLSDGRRLRLFLKPVRALAIAVMAVLFIALPILRQVEKGQAPLESCAHDATGKQLTACLQPYVPLPEPPR